MQFYIVQGVIRNFLFYLKCGLNFLRFFNSSISQICQQRWEVWPW